jgi:hypothetical protein
MGIALCAVDKCYSSDFWSLGTLFMCFEISFSVYVRVVVFFGRLSVIKGSSILSMGTSLNFELHNH